MVGLLRSYGRSCQGGDLFNGNMFGIYFDHGPLSNSQVKTGRSSRSRFAPDGELSAIRFARKEDVAQILSRKRRGTGGWGMKLWLPSVKNPWELPIFQKNRYASGEKV